ASKTSSRKCASPEVTPTVSTRSTSAAQSARKASASQPPVRCSVVIYSTFMRAGIWPQILGTVRFAEKSGAVLVAVILENRRGIGRQTLAAAIPAGQCPHLIAAVRRVAYNQRQTLLADLCESLISIVRAESAAI